MKFRLLALTILVVFSGTALAHANRLPRPLEKEAIELMNELGVDAWQEADVKAKFDAVLFDQEKSTVYVIYKVRDLSKPKSRFEKQKPLVIGNIHSLDEIILQAKNGYRYLNELISIQLIDTL